MANHALRNCQIDSCLVLNELCCSNSARRIGLRATKHASYFRFRVNPERVCPEKDAGWGLSGDFVRGTSQQFALGRSALVGLFNGRWRVLDSRVFV